MIVELHAIDWSEGINIDIPVRSILQVKKMKSEKIVEKTHTKEAK